MFAGCGEGARSRGEVEGGAEDNRGGHTVRGSWKHHGGLQDAHPRVAGSWQVWPFVPVLFAFGKASC